jgi:tryptophan-rich sensory protein
MRIDDIRFGLLLGFLVPVLGTFIYYFIQFRHLTTLDGFFMYLKNEKALLTAMISILLVVNIAIFTFFINKRKDKTAKGIFIASLVYGLGSVLWKMFG